MKLWPEDFEMFRFRPGLYNEFHLSLIQFKLECTLYYIRILFFRPRLNILIFLSMLG